MLCKTFENYVNFSLIDSHKWKNLF
jgi:hypothetical protein